MEVECGASGAESGDRSRVGIAVPSSSSHRRPSCDKSSPVPADLVNGWLLSFSHYVALYAMLVARLGTRCDCRKLRAKSEVVRRRSVSIAQKCQSSLLPIMVAEPVSDANQRLASTPLLTLPDIKSKWHGGKRTNNGAYIQLFYLHCAGLEFFIEQLIRTAQLFQDFSLNMGSSLTSSLMSPPANFIYSGLMEVERPKRKRSQLLAKRNKAVKSQMINESLFGMELEQHSKTTFEQSPNLDSGASRLELSLCSHETPGPSTDPSSNFTPHSEKKRTFTSLLGQLPSHQVPTTAPVKSPFRAFPEDPEVTASKLSPKASQKVAIEESQCKSSQPTVSLRTDSKKVAETDLECFEKLAKDTQTIRELIMEIYASVPMNPWAILPSQRKRRRRANQQRVGSLAGYTSSPTPTPECTADTEVCAEGRPSDSEGPADEDYDEDEEDCEDGWLQENSDFFMRRGIQKIWDSYAMRDVRAHSEALDNSGRRRSQCNRTMHRVESVTSGRVLGATAGSASGLRIEADFEVKDQEDHETLSSKRLRRKQYICLSLIIFFSIALFGSALGACIYLFS
ncbi:hypothetical protein AAHC03_05705 [Spirometra sp. Aus1]